MLHFLLKQVVDPYIRENFRRIKIWSENDLINVIQEQITEQTTTPSTTTDPSAVLLVDVPCDVSVFVGAAVRMNAGGTAVNALADSTTNSNVLGIAESKSSPTLCDVRLAGKTLAVFSGLDVAKEYYLSNVTPGLVTITPPTTSGHILVRVGQPFSATEFVVTKSNRTRRQ